MINPKVVANPEKNIPLVSFNPLYKIEPFTLSEFAKKKIKNNGVYISQTIKIFS